MLFTKHVLAYINLYIRMLGATNCANFQIRIKCDSVALDILIHTYSSLFDNFMASTFQPHHWSLSPNIYNVDKHSSRSCENVPLSYTKLFDLDIVEHSNDERSGALFKS